MSDRSAAPQHCRIRTLADRVLLGMFLLALVGCGDPRTPTEPGAGPEGHVILVSDFQFTPSRLTIRAGDTVTWRNSGGFHNVVAADLSFRCSEGCDDAGGDGEPSASAWSFTRTFDAPGVVPYFCWVHGGPGGAGMSGTIVVSAQ